MTEYDRGWLVLANHIRISLFRKKSSRWVCFQFGMVWFHSILVGVVVSFMG